MPFALNHMTTPRGSARDLLDMAGTLGCAGIELRNDLDGPLFDGETPEAFAERAADAGLQIYGLAEITRFNVTLADNLAQAKALIATAARCSAQGVALIPQVSEGVMSGAEQRAALHAALLMLQPILEDHGVRGLIEPLGFVQSTLRHKADAMAVLDALGRPACFGLIHDTFHHHIAGDTDIYPELTAVIHISGVSDPQPQAEEMTDAHRGLIGSDDRLGNVAQLRAFAQAGFSGPASFEAFAPDVHTMTDPATALAGSIAFITSQLAAPAAGAA